MTQLASKKRLDPDLLDPDFQAWLTSLTPATREFAGGMTRENKVNPEDVPLQWHVVQLVGDNMPEVVSFDLFEGLVRHMQNLYMSKSAVRVFLFWGAKVLTSKKPHIFIIHPNGTRVPIFKIPDETEMELDVHGDFTDDPDEAIPEVDQFVLGSQVIRSQREEAETVTADAFDGSDYDEYDEEPVDNEDYSDEEPDLDE